jgi:hypothetical protein
VGSGERDAKTQASSSRRFNKVIEEDLIEVVKSKSTDHHQRTVYHWRFPGGIVETRQSKDDKHSHFDWGHFRHDYFDATDEMPDPPENSGSEDWVAFLVEQIEENLRVDKSKGPRTCAVDELRGNIRSKTGYAELEDAIRHDGVYIDDDPENGDPDEVWVPNAIIKRICDNNELNSTRALQLELDARGLSSPQIVGVSHTERINDRSVTFWRLAVDIATPAGYVTDPKTPAQKVAKRNAQKDGDGGSQGSGQIDSVTGDTGGDSDE